MEYLPTILIAAAIAAIVVLVIVREIRNRKKGKCSCGCSGCALKDTSHPQIDKNITYNDS